MNTTENQDGQYSSGTPIKMINDRQMRLLIVDDSKLLRKKLRDEIEKLGCEVFEASNGKEAIAFDLEHEPDGIILDIVMPGRCKQFVKSAPMFR